MRMLNTIDFVMANSIQDNKGIWHKKPIALYSKEESLKDNNTVKRLFDKLSQ